MGIPSPSQQERLLDSGMALRDALAFVAHEINTPLALIQGYAQAQLHGTGAFATAPRPTDAVLQALQATERSARRCLALMSLITETSHSTLPRLQRQHHSASELVQALLVHYPFVGREKQCVSMAVEQDFPLPSQAELLQLALSILLRHLLQTLHKVPQPRLHITLGRQGTQHHIRLSGNGAAWSVEDVKAMMRPHTAHAETHPPDLLFCLRVIRSLRGGLHATSSAQGAEVLLQFPSPDQEETNSQEKRT